MREAFAEIILRKHTEDNTFLHRIFWTDEATFTRGGYHNSHNLHFYAPENPHLARPVNFQRQFKLNVWAAVVDNKVIGPHYFDGNLNGEIYAHFLEHDLPLLLERAELNIHRLWFQHDGAPPHYSVVARTALNIMFHNRWIGRLGGFDRAISWPPRSPDLTPLDFYLWGTVKDMVYTGHPIATIDELRQRIDNAFLRIRQDPNHIRNAVESVGHRLRIVIRENGGYIENHLWPQHTL